LERLHELERIDALSFETARDAPITARRHIADVDIQAPFISEMARQLVFDRFGESVYQQGLNVTVTINSAYQEKSNQALRKGLIDYDKRHGFRGPISNIALDAFSGDDPDGRLIEELAQFPASKELIPAVITQMDEQSFQGMNQRGETGTAEWENIVWARKYLSPNSLGPELTAVDDILTVGDVVYVRDLGEGKWMLSQLPEVSGALVSLDAKTGAILALTGGFDYYLSKFNRATQAERQPGSNIKPFIYSAALDNGFTASSLVSAAPIVVDDSLEGVWRPQNYSKKFFGPTPLRKALSLSLNLVSVRLLRAMGIDTTIDHLVDFGFDRERLPENLSLALGSTSITPLGLASRFAGLANGGFRVTPFLIEKIEDSEGNRIELSPIPCENCGDEAPNLSIDDATISKVIESEEQNDVETVSPESSESDEVVPDTESRRAISPQNAFLMQSLLKQVILTGTGRRALALNRTDLAGKTGTTNNFRDAWFSGFNPDVVTTVFVGFDEPSHLGKRESGASAALPIWVDFMGLVLQDFPEKPVQIPENITTRFINKDTGQVTAPDDPDGYSEYFVVGTEPNNLPIPVTDSGETSGGTDDNQSVSETLF
jgi:penicillin-binding protein 1A